MRTKNNNQKNKLKRNFKDNIFLWKWIAFISVYLILGGTFSFAIILLSYRIMESKTGIEPIWIVGMIPLMAIITFPLALIIYRQVKKNLSVLIKGMERVAMGDLDTYIPTANAKDFAKIYENFNKMVAEIQSIEILRISTFDNLSHELKTPIATINGFSHLLSEKDLTKEKKSKYLQIIIDESERLGSLVKNVLLLSKLDASEIISQKEKYSLNEQLQDCVISLENEWTTKNINLSAELDHCLYNGDIQLMKSLWLNLLSNAIKFTPENGSVSLILTHDEKMIKVAVSDTGVGIKEEDLEHIFEKHYQGNKKVSSKGQGLGLAIVKRIVKLCNGTIEVESIVDKGSTFTIYLPK